MSYLKIEVLFSDLSIWIREYQDEDDIGFFEDDTTAEYLLEVSRRGKQVQSLILHGDSDLQKKFFTDLTSYAMYGSAMQLAHAANTAMHRRLK